LVFLSLIRCSSTLYWQVVPLLKCPVRACLRPHTCFSAPFSPFTRKAKGNKHTHNKTKHKKDIVFIVLEHSVARARNVEKKGRTRIQYAGHVKHEIREFALSLSISLARAMLLCWMFQFLLRTVWLRPAISTPSCRSQATI
jgi:hypothetical protein